MLETYTEGFASLKANRTLEWKGKLGIVDLTVELSDRTVELSVTPAQATVLMAFQNQSENIMSVKNWDNKRCWLFLGSWSVDALSREVQMTQSLLAKRLAFWVGHGVLREDMTSTFSIVEKQQDGSTRIGKKQENYCTSFFCLCWKLLINTVIFGYIYLYHSFVKHCFISCIQGCVSTPLLLIV